MNKQWIEASHFHARSYSRRIFLSDSEEYRRHPTYEYLDIMGLFETGWMIYDFDTYANEKIKYGYPR